MQARSLSGVIGFSSWPVQQVIAPAATWPTAPLPPGSRAVAAMSRHDRKLARAGGEHLVAIPGDQECILDVHREVRHVDARLNGDDHARLQHGLIAGADLWP